MLSYLLFWIIGLGSVGFYLSGFLLPEVARKYDLIWGGLGLIYALDLLADHRQIRGGLLLGQMASVALIVWFGWQTIQQRRQLTPEGERTPLPNSVDGALPFLKQGWERLLVAYGQDTPEGSDNVASETVVPETVVDSMRSAASTVSVKEDLDKDGTPELKTPIVLAPEETAVAETDSDSPAPEPLSDEPSAQSLETEHDAQDNIAEPEVSSAVSTPPEEPTAVTPEVATPEVSSADPISAEEAPTDDSHISQVEEGNDWPPREIDA
jgi:hypothetical protein